MRSYYLASVINHATRNPPETDKNPTLLDHIWINFMGDNYISGSILHDETDHCPIFLNVKTNYTMDTTNKNKFRDYSNESIDKFRDKLCNCYRLGFRTIRKH